MYCNSINKKKPRKLTLSAALTQFFLYRKDPSAVRHAMNLQTFKDLIDLRLLLVSLVKRYVWSARRAQNGVSRALFHPEIASEYIYWPRVSLGAQLACNSSLARQWTIKWNQASAICSNLLSLLAILATFTNLNVASNSQWCEEPWLS